MKSKKTIIISLLASALTIGANVLSFGETYVGSDVADVWNEGGGIDEVTVTVPSGADVWGMVYTENDGYASISGSTSSGSYSLTASTQMPSEPKGGGGVFWWESNVKFKDKEGTSGTYTLYAMSGSNMHGLSSIAQATINWY